MDELNAQTEELADARGAIVRSRDSVQDQIQAVGDKMALSKDQIEAKLKEFQQVNSELGKIAENLTEGGQQ